MTIEPNNEQEMFLAVQPNFTLEVCLTKLWTNAGEGCLDYELTFYGTRPRQNVEMVGPIKN